MSMGAVLKVVRDHLRNRLSLASGQCDVRPDGRPIDAAGDLYVCISEGGVQSESRLHLSERYEIEVSIWRRATAAPTDRQGDLLLPDDQYLANMTTLDDLERAVIAQVHGNDADIRQAANAVLISGGASGDGFSVTLFYAGRGPSETFADHARANVGWIGRRLRFGGMLRVQPLSVME
jgi:hypothetical protein